MPALIVNTTCIGATVALLAGVAATGPVAPVALAAGVAALGGLAVVAAIAWRLAVRDGFPLPKHAIADAATGALIEIPTPANDPAPGHRLTLAADGLTRDLLVIDGVVPANTLPQLFRPRARITPLAVNEPLALLPA